MQTIGPDCRILTHTCPCARPVCRRRGQQIRSQPEFGGSFLQETVATGKDARAVALCAACGSPHHLQQCSGCKLVRWAKGWALLGVPLGCRVGGGDSRRAASMVALHIDTTRPCPTAANQSSWLPGHI